MGLVHTRQRRREALNDHSLPEIIQRLLRLAPGWYYFILFGAFVAEGTSFPLVHVPSMIMFLASAYLVSAGRISLLAAVVVAAIGSTVGGFITYLLGSRMSSDPGETAPGSASGELAEPATPRHPHPARGLRRWVSPDRLRRVHRLVNRYGALFALTARWLGVLRPAALLGTGLARVSPWKVVPALFAGSIVYCVVYQFVALGLEAVSLRLLGRVSLEWILLSALGLALVWSAGLLLFRKARL
jgi:membrane protein DedA with SNARE-associated domain